MLRRPGGRREGDWSDLARVRGVGQLERMEKNKRWCMGIELKASVSLG